MSHLLTLSERASRTVATSFSSVPLRGLKSFLTLFLQLSLKRYAGVQLQSQDRICFFFVRVRDLFAVLIRYCFLVVEWHFFYPTLF